MRCFFLARFLLENKIIYSGCKHESEQKKIKIEHSIIPRPFQEPSIVSDVRHYKVPIENVIVLLHS
jgi:hypothetical protein